MTSKETILLAISSLNEKESKIFLDYLIASPMVVSAIEAKPKRYDEDKLDQAWHLGFSAGSSESLGYVAEDFDINDYEAI